MCKAEKINIPFIILSVLTFYIIYLPLVNVNILVLSVFTAIAQLSLIGVFLVKQEESYSLNKTFHIFTYFFFGLAPALQFKYRITFDVAPLLLEETFLTVGLTLLFSQTIYLVSYHFAYIFFKKKKTFNLKKEKQSINAYYLLLISFFSFLITFYLFDYNYILLFEQQPVGWQKINTKHGLLGYSLLLSVRVIPVISFLYYKLRYRQVNIKLLGLLFLIVLLTVFPTSLARSVIAAYYLPIILIMFQNVFLKKYVYALFYFFSFLIVFPLFNFFRNGFNKIDLGLNLLKSAHMDAFQNFGYLFQEKFITNGRQLMGSILFFIPESIWGDRPVGTGRMIAEKLNFSHTNIAFPFLGEGYANFGYMGTLLFLVIITLINSFFDSKREEFFKKRIAFLQIFFLYFLGFEFYLLRGDLYSSFKLFSSFFIGLILFWTFINLLSKSKYKCI